MMNEGRLPHLARLRAQGSFSKLGTSIPPQSPVAWANFINGAGPGSHGIFDFIHRHPHEQRDQQCSPLFYSAAELMPGEGFWEIGDYNVQVDFWPVNHRPPSTLLRRQGTPFWDYLDAAGVPSTFYDLPCNYPPSPSQHGHHRCIAGMGTPDLLGTYGTYQHFAENGPAQTEDEKEGAGKRSRLTFSSETARATLLGPDNSMRRAGGPVTVDFLVHRDVQANAAVIEIQGRRLVLRAGEWSRWIQVDFCLLDTPALVPDKHVSGICRFFLQAVAPTFKLYVSPINIDPSAPAVKISEPEPFIQDVSKRLGLFATTGFQEDFEARKNRVFTEDEFIKQADKVLEERLALFEYAVQNYDDGLLYFYFSSSDLQSHLLWWNPDESQPCPSSEEPERGFAHVQRLYQKLDAVIGDIVDRYGSQATIIVMSDHGFANFGRQFCLNTWLRNSGYLDPECESIRRKVDWSQTFAYGLGINGLYLNLKGRESHGIVEPGEEQERLLTKLANELEDLTELDGRRVIRKVYRADQIYQGNATALAPDLIIGYCRGYRASWDTCMGDLTQQPDGQREVLLDNTKAWKADHCADALEVPGVLFSNRALRVPGRWRGPSLVDVAPSILAEYGLPTPPTMVGRNIF
jgi:predicted AlkP superfamily phosphohydrolase/phosphomutase